MGHDLVRLLTLSVFRDQGSRSWFPRVHVREQVRTLTRRGPYNMGPGRERRQSRVETSPTKVNSDPRRRHTTRGDPLRVLIDVRYRPKGTREK